MRDIGLVLIFLCAAPFILKRPALGIIMWVWLSLMNPHRLTYGFAYYLNFAAAAAILTFIALLITKDERRLPLTPPTVFLGMFMLWMCVTSLMPFHPGSGYEMWSRVMKILLMTFVALTVIRNKQQIHWLVWILAFSLGFFGTKGGVFTVLHGGSFLVWGPEGSFIEGNNELALALITVIPLMRYIQLDLKKKWQRNAMTAVMLLTAFSAIGSHSRGALLGIAAMATFLWWKSRNKFGMGIALVVIGIVMLGFMPDEWWNRMNSIKTYDADESAQGRINAWWMAWNLATDRFFGGGYEIYDFDVFRRYAPNPTDVHAAHSIYFQVLGEHGFIGLFLFMAVGASTWLAAGDAKRKAKGVEDLKWVGPLMDMSKVSMVGFGVGGAFLSLAYFDLPYYVLVVVVSVREIAVRARKAIAVHDPRVARRADRFGVVPAPLGMPIVDPPPAGAPPRRPRADDWRGQGSFSNRPLGLDSKGPTQ